MVKQQRNTMASTPKPIRKHLKTQLEIGRKAGLGKKFAERTEKSIKKGSKMDRAKGRKTFGVTSKGKYVGNE